MAMDINEACRGVVYRHAEAEKEKLTGQVKIILSYQDGAITKATTEKISPLIPGGRGPSPSREGYDVPGKNLG
jgi:hypothetical protein